MLRRPCRPLALPRFNRLRRRSLLPHLAFMRRCRRLRRSPFRVRLRWRRLRWLRRARPRPPPWLRRPRSLALRLLPLRRWLLLS